MHREKWFEAFFIQSMFYSMASLLKEEHRADFDQFILDKMRANKIINSAMQTPRDEAKARRFSELLGNKGPVNSARDNMDSE